MFIPFETVRQQALVALYRLTYASDKQEYFSQQDIADEARLAVGGVFLGRALRELVASEFVESSSWEENDSQYTLTNLGWNSAEKLVRERLGDANPVEGVPASDRVVSIGDNQREEVESTIDQIVNQVTASNEVGFALSDSKDRIKAELDAGRRLVKPAFVRLGAIIAVLATPLRFLAEKFSGEAIGELAKKLLNLLWDMINSQG